METKNIFVIPTTEPSQVYLVKKENALGLTSKNPESMEHYGSGTHNQHIYITIKDPYVVGDWCIEAETGNVFKVKEVKEFSSIVRCEKETYVYDACMKIVITTDLKLVADSVKQADLEFLSWLSSFPLGIIENVMVEKIPLLSNNGRALYGYSYKTVIFKESLQQAKSLEETPTDIVLDEVFFKKGDKVLFTGKILDEEVIDKPVTVFYTLGRGAQDDMSDIMDEYTHIYRVWNKDLKHISKEEPKKETVEEYYLPLIKNMLEYTNDALAMRFMEKYYHAKKEKESSYSEEGVGYLINLLKQTTEYEVLQSFRDKVEQFKKK